MFSKNQKKIDRNNQIESNNKVSNKNGFMGEPVSGLLAMFAGAQSVVIGCVAGFMGFLISQYNKPDSFVRYNTDASIRFFINTFNENVVPVINNSKTCLQNADAKTPPSEVLKCIMKSQTQVNNNP